MTFSGALRLTDLNDFLGPSNQACIKPVEQLNPITAEKEPGAASTEIHIDAAGAYYEVDQSSGREAGKKLEQAQISLNDCLACSGCITSAESVLITLQSHIEVLDFLKSNELPSAAPGTKDRKKIPVISIAPQTLASLATSLSVSQPQTSSSEAPVTTITPRQVLRRIRTFCKEVLGFEHVFDTTFARHIALNEHVKEFKERQSSSDAQLPMLASACPGWICYAEKTHPEMLPFISATKSPQQVMGSLVKHWMGREWSRAPDEIYHVSVMPCYDKKLEASRGDFYNEVYATRDVDCVITTGELDILMKEKGWDLSISVPGERDDIDTTAFDIDAGASTLPELLSHSGTSSGSYLHSIMNHLSSTSATPLMLEVKQIRNVDYEEYILRKADERGSTRPNEDVVFKGARCYGFRNLTNIVRKVKQPSGGIKAVRKAVAHRPYDYVEVMACPGGCVNGGGQLKPVALATDSEGYSRDWEDSGVRWGNKEWTKKVEEMYWQDSASQTSCLAHADALMDSILKELCQTDEGLGDVDLGQERDLCRKQFFRTQYHAIKGEENGLATTW